MFPLHDGDELLELDGLDEEVIAVGYESASQFGRKFKRLFGVTPLAEVEQTRARIVAG